MIKKTNLLLTLLSKKLKTKGQNAGFNLWNN